MLVGVVCREKKEVSNEIALFYVAFGPVDGTGLCFRLSSLSLIRL
jgi:hypothetical protein